MDIQSEPTRGTRIHLRFPAYTKSGGPVEQEEEVNTAPSPDALKVLIIDDDELIRASSEMILEALGHVVTTASGGEEALARLEAGYDPDLAILDMNMPGLGGSGTLPRLRVLRPTLPVLLATGRADQTALDLVESDEFTALLAKPFSIEEMQRAIQAVWIQPEAFGPRKRD